MGRRIKRFLDILLSSLALLVMFPLLLIAAAGVRCSSPGPVFYRARRMGKDLRPFDVFKFRSMRTGADREGGITAAHDSRVFPFGAFLRKTKIDELPQLVNILRGEMSIIGPRPEDVDIVLESYTPEQKRTLEVLPGLASPGSIFNYTHGDRYLQGDNAEEDYIRELMPVKLDMDLYYVEHWSLLYDAELLFRTVYVIAAQLLGKTEFPYPREYREERPTARV